MEIGALGVPQKRGSKDATIAWQQRPSEKATPQTGCHNRACLGKLDLPCIGAGGFCADAHSTVFDHGASEPATHWQKRGTALILDSEGEGPPSQPRMEGSPFLSPFSRSSLLKSNRRCFYPLTRHLTSRKVAPWSSALSRSFPERAFPAFGLAGVAARWVRLRISGRQPPVGAKHEQERSKPTGEKRRKKHVGEGATMARKRRKKQAKLYSVLCTEYTNVRKRKGPQEDTER